MAGMAAFETIPLYRDSRHLVVSPRHPLFEQMMAGDARALKKSPLIASTLDNPDMRPSIQRQSFNPGGRENQRPSRDRIAPVKGGSMAKDVLFGAPKRLAGIVLPRQKHNRLPNPSVPDRVKLCSRRTIVWIVLCSGSCNTIRPWGEVGCGRIRVGSRFCGRFGALIARGISQLPASFEDGNSDRSCQHRCGQTQHQH